MLLGTVMILDHGLCCQLHHVQYATKKSWLSCWMTPSLAGNDCIDCPSTQGTQKCVLWQACGYNWSCLHDQLYSPIMQKTHQCYSGMLPLCTSIDEEDRLINSYNLWVISVMLMKIYFYTIWKQKLWNSSHFQVIVFTQVLVFEELHTELYTWELTSGSLCCYSSNYFRTLGYWCMVGISLLDHGIKPYPEVLQDLILPLYTHNHSLPHLWWTFSEGDSMFLTIHWVGFATAHLFLMS